MITVEGYFLLNFARHPFIFINIVRSEVKYMLYVLAFFLPPVAVLLVGKPIQALINLFLSILLYVPGVIHAILVIRDHKADKRMERQVKLMKKNNL